LTLIARYSRVTWLAGLAGDPTSVVMAAAMLLVVALPTTLLLARQALALSPVRALQ
jgi:hypothetical protein